MKFYEELKPPFKINTDDGWDVIDANGIILFSMADVGVEDIDGLDEFIISALNNEWKKL